MNAAVFFRAARLYVRSHVEPARADVVDVDGAVLFEGGATVLSLRVPPPGTCDWQLLMLEHTWKRPWDLVGRTDDDRLFACRAQQLVPLAVAGEVYPIVVVRRRQPDARLVQRYADWFERRWLAAGRPGRQHLLLTADTCILKFDDEIEDIVDAPVPCADRSRRRVSFAIPLEDPA